MPLSDSLACYATTAPGFEPWLGAELAAIGVAVVASERGGVEFTATAAQLADALLWSRIANRIVVRIASFRARAFGELERHAGAIPWANVLGGSARPVHFRVSSKKSRLYHEDGIAERLARSVAASGCTVSATLGAADAEALEADVSSLPGVHRFVVRVLRDEFTISADASGALLHMRGYRQAVAKAPLRETLAAGLLAASGWTIDCPLLDPMCGSGTIVIEAALMARQVAPGRQRRFAMELWPGMLHELDSARARAKYLELPAAGVAIAGQDRDAGAITASRANAARAGVAEDVTFTQAALSSTPADDGSGWVITNPPYGTRVGESGPLRDLYATLGKVMQQRLPSWRLAMISADRMLEGQVGTQLNDVVKTENGGLAVRVIATE